MECLRCAMFNSMNRHVFDTLLEVVSDKFGQILFVCSNWRKVAHKTARAISEKRHAFDDRLNFSMLCQLIELYSMFISILYLRTRSTDKKRIQVRLEK